MVSSRVLTSFVLVLGLCPTALADDPPGVDAAPPPAEAAPAADTVDAADDEAPPPPPAAPPPEHVVVTSAEPMGRGDDRVARRIEELLTAHAQALSDCRTSALGADPEPLRFAQILVQFKRDGSFRKTDVGSSTGHAAVDACVLAIVSGFVLDPPPQFPDKLEINVTWRKPKADGT
ncbi:MAG: hypothetical protein H6733_02660 [Alphaproteobacteria bacterium]|nr:hypothetical protein [Alphaproteobacteria bacterium]